LRQQLDAPELPLDSCSDIVEFRQKAPLDEISLIFASETIAQPASMLGHAFLKFSGINEHGWEVSHAISFYTDIDTYNIPKLLFDSLVIGKKGFFSLSPYYEKQQRYVDEEQRNVWEYPLTLDKFQKELFRLHIIELKQTHLTYFFQKYNCATVLNFILALSGKTIPESGGWVTPLDVIKNAHQAGLINDVQVITPSRWLYRALATQVGAKEQQSIREQIKLGNVADLDMSGSDQAYVQLEFARAYNQYAYLVNGLSKDIWLANEHSIKEAETQNFLGKSLSADDRYNPLNTPGDSQVSYATQSDEIGQSFVLTLLPISHTLSDDNRNYANETSLQLFAVSFRLRFQHVRPELDRFTLFDMQSLMPYDEVTGGVSGRFHIAIEPQQDKNLEASHVLTTSGAIGLTKRITQDVDTYSLVGGGLGITGRRSYIYTTLEAGAILREVWNMKTLLSVVRTDNQIDNGTHYFTMRLSQSKFINKVNTINVDWLRDLNNNHQRNTVTISLKKIF
jgi:hypothetical protein